MDLPPQGHQPVLIKEVLDLLTPQPGETFIDCTLGRAGHALAIAHHLGPTGLLIGLDADPRNLDFAADRLKAANLCRTRLFHANFSELDEVLAQIGPVPINGILADLGVSTNQLLTGDYGLSFDRDAPLDMRLDPRIPRTAADWVNRTSETDLANVLYNYAQERHSRRIARKIGEARAVSPILTTGQLADVVRRAMPPMKPRHGSRRAAPIDPATRTFLALRMAVNSETANLEALLEQAPKVLTRGGRFGVISFQSTEDRFVKQAFGIFRQVGTFELLSKKGLGPTDAEIAENPRSRSARLRGIVKR